MGRHSNIPAAVPQSRTIADLLDRLESTYGPQEPNFPVDPYEFLVWWYCGYPASDAACAKGWARLTADVGIEPEKLLKAKPEASNVAIARQVKADDKTVASERKSLEARSEIPNVDRIIACMNAKRASLSAPFKSVFDKRQRMMEAERSLQ